jgi:hypothetical protein
VLLPPGATFPSVLVIKPAASEAEALKMVEHEMTLTRDDMGSDAVVVTNVSWETSGGLNLAGKDFAVVEDGASVHTVITHRYEAGTLVIAVVNAGEDNIEQARKFLGTVLDATHFEP